MASHPLRESGSGTELPICGVPRSVAIGGKADLTTARSLAVVHSWRHHRLHLPDCSGPVRGCGCSPQTPHKNHSAPTRHDDRILATIEASDLAVAVDRRAWGKVGLWALRRGR